MSRMSCIAEVVEGGVAENAGRAVESRVTVLILVISRAAGQSRLLARPTAIRNFRLRAPSSLARSSCHGTFFRRDRLSLRGHSCRRYQSQTSGPRAGRRYSPSCPARFGECCRAQQESPALPFRRSQRDLAPCPARMLATPVRQPSSGQTIFSSWLLPPNPSLRIPASSHRRGHCISLLHRQLRLSCLFLGRREDSRARCCSATVLHGWTILLESAQVREATSQVVRLPVMLFSCVRVAAC